jgi:hypothetical protein
MKRIIAIVLTVVLIAAVFWVVNPFNPAYAEEYREGFALTPLQFDATGIYTDTDFVLKTEKAYTLGQVESMLRLLDDNQLSVKVNKKNEYLVTPEKELNTNSLYTFVITTPDNKTVSWTFQTRRDFSILGTLPAHQSSYVPANSGIEIYFSHTGFGDIDKYFEISPKAEGRFERNGYAAVFVPKKLEPGTIYTVTLKKGLPLDGTNQKLTADYIFAFETEPERDNNYVQKGSLYFNSMLMEFATDSAPIIPIGVYASSREVKEVVVATNIYKFKDLDSFIAAVKHKYDQPYWAYSAQESNLASKEGLSKVASFEQTFDLSQWRDKYLSVPEALTQGFYLVESTMDDITAQVLIQSTDLSAYYTVSDTKSLVWLNNLKDGKPVSAAQVTAENETFETDENGVAAFDTIKNDSEKIKSELEYLIIESGNDQLLLIKNQYRTYRQTQYAMEDYWRYFQTDRNLYKPDDFVQFWGFAKNRHDDTTPKKLTVEISEGGYWGIYSAKILNYFFPSIQKPLVTLNIPAEKGFFEGELKLPSLSPGSYQLTIKNGDEIINSHYISVENYVKPAYKMTVEKDKNAIFLGETVNFTIIPSFFDGTPLPSLDVTYNINGHPFGNVSNSIKTSNDGKLTVPFTAETTDETAQGERNAWLNATATLPESGMINGNDYIRVFINDIYAAFDTKSDEKGKITLNAKLNLIDLEPLNNPKPEDASNYLSYLGEPVADKLIEGLVIYHTYDKIEDGEIYDYINKVVNKRYRYEERKETVRSFSFRTDKDGKASETFTLEYPRDGYYTAELSWQDGNGRQMSRSVYLSNRTYIKSPEIQNDWYHLELNKEKYRLDDEVVVTLKNNEDTVDPESVLFIEAQKGIKKYSVIKSGEYKTSLTKEYIPNFYVKAIYFNGKTYIDAGTGNVAYDTDEVKINLEAEADKDAYRPGDTVTIKITAKDENGNPVAAKVNLSLIDEAMLEISRYNVNVLGTLYQWLSSGFGYSYSTHGYGSNVTRDMVYGGIAGAGFNDMAMESAAPAAKMDDGRAKSTMAMNSMMSDVSVRSEFKDTALFRVTSLNEDGTGTVTFKLPDNVTSWQVNLAAISNDLHGGTGQTALKVTLPFFINDSLNTVYLSGDFPYIGVSSYGNDLKEGETITWQVTSPQIPEFLEVSTSKAYERIYLPLWQMEAGVYDIEIRAISESGLSDGIRRTIYVSDTYHEIEEAVVNNLKANMELTGGNKGLTTLIFTDTGRGKLVPPLYSLLYSGGSRFDQKYISYKAKLLLDEIVPDRDYYIDISEVDITQYQKPDGGFGILPYSESDAEVSALMAQLLKDEPGAQMLKQYFYSLILSEPGRVNAPALYGLSVMGEPVLVDLNKAKEVSNLSLKDYMYLALAYDALGETPIAAGLYKKVVTPVLETALPYTRVAVSKDSDEILKHTALAAVLASKLDAPEKNELFLYIRDNYSKKILINIEKLLFVMEEYTKLPAADMEFTYEYDGNTYTEELKEGGSIIVKVPSVKLSDLNIKKVSGDASVVSVFKAPLTSQVQPDNNLKIKRTYYNYATGKETTEFKHNDLVKVVLDWDIADIAMDHYYEITDFAPSGLKPIESPYQAGIREKGAIIWWFRNTDGQKVTFNVYRDSEKKEPLIYYARVVSPGTFKADGTIIQGTTVKDSIKISDDTTITITE